MAMLKVGHYPIGGNLEHSFAVMEYNGEEYRFQCCGSVYDGNRSFPANYYHCRNAWYTRNGSKTSETNIPCNARIAIALAQWSGDVDWGRHDYDRKGAGWLGFGDSSGIVYGLNGVCHQMCNTIACASWTHDPLASLINWPPSLNVSKLFYDNRGTWGHEGAIESLITSIKQKYGDAISDEEFAARDEAVSGEFDALFASVYEQQRNAMRRALDDGPDAAERCAIVGANVPDGADGGAFDSVLAADADAMAQKHELDNLLVRGQISNVDFADRTNALIRTLAEQYEKTLGQEAFLEAFGGTAENINCNVIDPAMMPDSYNGLREELGL